MEILLCVGALKSFDDRLKSIFDRIAVGENPMKEIEKRPGMDPEITRMMNEAWQMEAPELD